ncbi:MAG: hypothetical protein WDN04_15525 [Rhodospirillales bacterium]
MAILGGVVVVAAIAGGAIYVMQNRPAPRPAEPAVAVAPAAPTPPAASAAADNEAKPALPDSSAAGTGSVPDIATIDFVPTTGQFTITKPSAAFVAASGDSPQMYPLEPGIGVRATEQSKDGKWVIALTEDGQAAFLPMDNLGPYQPGAENSVPAVADPVAGRAEVVDTATLTVNGQRVALFGIEGETGVLADQLQDLINASGPSVKCEPHDQTYVCVLPDGSDVARAALYNGAARPGPDATDDYRQVSDAAKNAHKGIWR